MLIQPSCKAKCNILYIAGPKNNERIKNEDRHAYSELVSFVVSPQRYY